MTRVSGITPLDWNSEVGLLLLRRDSFVAGDAGRVACDSTGVFARDLRGRVTARRVDADVCARVGLSLPQTIAVSPTGAWLAFLSAPGSRAGLIGDRASAIVRLDSTCVGGGDGIDEGVAWRRDGQRIALVRRCEREDTTATLAVASIGSAGSATRLLAHAAGTPSWSPDGRSIAIVRQSPKANPSSSSSTSRRFTSSELGGRPSARITAPLVWSPDERYLAVTEGIGTWIVGLADSSMVPIRRW